MNSGSGSPTRSDDRERGGEEPPPVVVDGPHLREPVQRRRRVRGRPGRRAGDPQVGRAGPTPRPRTRPAAGAGRASAPRRPTSPAARDRNAAARNTLSGSTVTSSSMSRTWVAPGIPPGLQDAPGEPPRPAEVPLLDHPELAPGGGRHRGRTRGGSGPARSPGPRPPPRPRPAGHRRVVEQGRDVRQEVPLAVERAVPGDQPHRVRGRAGRDPLAAADGDPARAGGELEVEQPGLPGVDGQVRHVERHLVRPVPRSKRPTASTARPAAAAGGPAGPTPAPAARTRRPSRPSRRVPPPVASKKVLK